MKPCVHRLAIAQLVENGERIQVHYRLQVPLRTVQRIVKQWKSVGNVEVKKKSNTFEILSIPEELCSHQESCEWHRKRDSIATSLGISRQSVQSIVKNSLGLRSYRLYRGQHLSDDAELKRLKKCKKMLKFSKRAAWKMFCGRKTRKSSP